MTEEKVEETTEETQEEETQEVETEESAETDDSQDIDYKEELEKLQKTVASDAYKYRQEKREDKEEEDETETLTVDSIRQIIQEETSKISVSVRKDTLSAKAHSMARNADEAGLALYHLENTLKGGTGDTDQDLKNAFALANQGRSEQVIKEIKRAVDVKKGKADVAGSKKSVTKAAPEVSEADAKVIKQFGLVWNPDKINPDTGKKGDWEKPAKK